mgnify:CR=1 FL=1
MTDLPLNKRMEYEAAKLSKRDPIRSAEVSRWVNDVREIEDELLEQAKEIKNLKESLHECEALIQNGYVEEE